MEITEILRFLAALLFVVGLITACAWAARRFNLVPTGARASGNNRLAVSESLTIDPKRKLIVVRYDDKEHLLLLGENDLVLDQGLAVRHDLIAEAADRAANPSPVTTPVAEQMQKVVTFLKERRA